MNVDRLFNVLVVGGAALGLAACGGDDGGGSTGGGGGTTSDPTTSAGGGGASGGSGGAGGATPGSGGAGGAGSVDCSPLPDPGDACGCPCCWVTECFNDEPCCSAFCQAGNSGQGCCGG